MTAIGKAAVQISSRKGGKVPEADIGEITRQTFSGASRGSAL
jgi:hypothetical protein